MDNKENTQEFSLEDIMREFGSDTAEEPAEVISGEAPAAAEAAEVPAPAFTPEEPPAEASREDADESDAFAERDTDELPAPEEIAEAAASDDTIRVEALAGIVDAARENASAAPGSTIRVEELAEFVDAALAETDGEETGDSEPEDEDYDEDGAEEAYDSEYEEAEDEASGEGREIPPEELPPPAPIIFRSRLRELKRQLVAGPEKRYYDLSEIGLGRVQAAIFVSILIVLLCAGATALYAMGMVMENRLRLMIFSQVLAMMVSAALGCYVLMDGIADLFKGKFTLNTMLVFTLIACTVDAVFCLRELRVPCCAAFSLEMTMALWNRYLRRHTEMGQMDTLRKAVRLDSLVKVDDYYDGRPGILRGEGQVEDFMNNYDAPSGPEKVQNLFALVSLALCVGIAVLAGVRHGLSLAFQILATSLLVAIPASFFVSASRPAAVLQRRLHMVGTVICGWQGVKGLCGKAAFPLRDQDIFPLGASKLNGVKFFGDREPDETIAYATALIRANGGGLEPVFMQLLKSRNGALYGVENFRSYEGGGIGGEVCGEPVLLGTLNFLQDMGVEIPEGTMVNQAVYCSIDGQLSAVFAINYNRMKSAAGGLVTICGYRKLYPVVLSTDFMITESLLSSKFGIRTKRFSFPTREVRDELSRIQPDPERVAFAMTTQEGLSSAAYAVTGARALRTASRAGLAIHMLGGILGMLIMAALAYIGDPALLTPVNVLLYQLVWMVPGLLITEWTRAV